MMPIQAVLFDLDDTLWPILPVIARAETVLHDWLAIHAPAVAERFSIDQLRTQRLKLMAVDPRYQIDLQALRQQALHDAFLSVGADVGKVAQAMQVFAAARNEVTLFADVLPTLEWLQPRVPLGAISNGTADLQAIGLADYFDVILSAPRVGCAKPGAAIFHLACDALHIEPAQALYIGDDPLLDIRAAQQVGMQTMWLNRFGRPALSHVHPDAVCQTLHGLPRWLSERLAASDGMATAPTAG
jgi:putative hydrolase of the HAD superfamily